MAEHRWIQTLFLLILEFQFTGASYFIRGGGDITLTCKDVINDQNNCDKTVWLFSRSGNTSAVELVNRGKIKTESNSKSDRLSVTENCSLVIKKVTDEDAGRYSCRQFESGRQQGSDSVVDVSVVTMTQHKDTDKAMFICSVWTHGPCSYTLKWLYDGKDVKINPSNLLTSQSSCNTTVHFLTSLYQSNSFTCEVTDDDTNQQFTFTLYPQTEKPGDNKITATTPKTELSATTASTNTGTKPAGLLRFIFVPVALAALIIAVVTVNIWTRTREDKHEDKDEGTVKCENVGDSSASVRLH